MFDWAWRIETPGFGVCRGHVGIIIVQTIVVQTNLWAASHLPRINQIVRLLTDQIHMTETMAPQDFFAFREALIPASGTESLQFREIEIRSATGVHRYKVADSETWAQPAISGNRIFVKDVSTLALWTLN